MMTGPQGTFGISKTQYENRLECSWKIQVETTKVGNTKYSIYYDLNVSTEQCVNSYCELVCVVLC